MKTNHFHRLLLSNLKHIPLIDVRSPGEFAKGHIPNATNLELFTDEERQ
jgi:tRNA 2-selenouridine synthase